MPSNMTLEYRELILSMLSYENFLRPGADGEYMWGIVCSSGSVLGFSL